MIGLAYVAITPSCGADMPTNLKSLGLGLGLVAGLTIGAEAQTVSQVPVPGPSIANLPPEGPRPSSENNIPRETKMPVTASGKYTGPDPGTGYYGTYTYQKPANWDQNVSMHPYSSSMGPKPN
jgi:hypothetical protein